MNKTGKIATLLLAVMFITSTCILLDKPVSAGSAVGDSWTEKAPMSVGRGDLGVAVVDGKIYAIGGTLTDEHAPVNVNEEYDPANDSWTYKQQIPVPRCMFATAVYQNKIYCIGGVTGINGSFKVTGLNQVYDPATDSWETKASMPTPRSFLSANVVNGKIYVMGGRDENYTALTVNEVYDPANNSWTTKASMPGAIWIPASATVDNKIYVIGYGPGSFVWNTNQMYDPQTDNGLIRSVRLWTLKEAPQLLLETLYPSESTFLHGGQQPKFTTPPMPLGR
jgi:N-acetylneuraminic acid mutarotase